MFTDWRLLAATQPHRFRTWLWGIESCLPSPPTVAAAISAVPARHAAAATPRHVHVLRVCIITPSDAVLMPIGRAQPVFQSAHLQSYSMGARTLVMYLLCNLLSIP